MHRSVKSKTLGPPQDGLMPTPAQVKKARMLVSMLGADFAKTSTHPFFKELAQTAVRPLAKKSPPPDMSKALAKLVRRLADANEAKRVLKPMEVKPIEERPQAEDIQNRDPEILTQHPALIAKYLIGLPTGKQLDALRKLRGQTARQVAIYVAELKT
jgi:hypothetical protein